MISDHTVGGDAHIDPLPQTILNCLVWVAFGDILLSVKSMQNHRGVSVGTSVVVPEISCEQTSRNFDHCHKLRSLHPPPAALPSLSPNPPTTRGRQLPSGHPYAKTACITSNLCTRSLGIISLLVFTNRYFYRLLIPMLH